MFYKYILGRHFTTLYLPISITTPPKILTAKTIYIKNTCKILQKKKLYFQSKNQVAIINY